MRAKRFLILNLIICASLIMLNSCEKENDPVLKDIFTVTVDENPYSAGNAIAYSSDENTFVFCFSPSGQKFNPTDNGVWIADSEVTYSLWKEIYDWAQSKGYTIKNAGQAGSNSNFPKNHPVTFICWYSAVVWCNALTEYYNLHNGEKPDYGFVYTSNGNVVKDSDINNPEFDNLNIHMDATGFRLPTNAEWYNAARWPNTPDDYASGAADNYQNEVATQAVAWYNANSSADIHPVKEKSKNGLNLYDMSGNVKEIVIDKKTMYDGDYNNCGGAYNSNPDQVKVSSSSPIDRHSRSISQGFRTARTIGDDTHVDFEIDNNGGGGSLTPGSGTGYFTMNGDTINISRAILFDFNTLLNGQYVSLDLFSEGIDTELANSGGYTGQGSFVGFGPILTENDSLDNEMVYGDDEIMLISSVVDFDADVYPWEGTNGFIGARDKTLEVSLDNGVFTLTFTVFGTDHQYNEDVELKGTYVGTIAHYVAGRDF